MTFPFVFFNQPVGDFILTAMRADQIIQISRAEPRTVDQDSSETGGGIQRVPSMTRVTEIAAYARTLDAAFPTSILLALKGDDCEFHGNDITIKRGAVAVIVDGQHRLLGLSQSGIGADFTIPVVLIIDATKEQEALIFATINGKQTKVPASLIYDLFGVTSGRSPQKTSHEIARAANGTPTSPWYRRLKMLGKKTTPDSTESLSQGTFVKFLLPHISKNPTGDRDLLMRGRPLPVYPDCIFNEYFREAQDAVISKIMLNVFQGARNTWPDDWDDPESSVLTKTLGFTGIMKALPEMYSKGKEHNDLSVVFFEAIFQMVKEQMTAENEVLTTQHFSASALGEAKFRNLISNAVQRYRPVP